MIEDLLPQGIAMSMISLAELNEGIIHSKDPIKGHDILDSFLSTGIEVINIDSEICRTFGNERGKLRQKNKLIGDFDLLIASTAIAYDLTLLSNNRNHYERIDELKIISL
ncbi:type II toxin-antitoxin system VapC family toxin, partial [bacterium]|nr:type II toxin-antitoxin system VapC family toxin [bacterium]